MVSRIIYSIVRILHPSDLSVLCELWPWHCSQHSLRTFWVIIWPLTSRHLTSPHRLFWLLTRNLADFLRSPSGHADSASHQDYGQHLAERRNGLTDVTIQRAGYRAHGALPHNTISATVAIYYYCYYSILLLPFSTATIYSGWSDSSSAERWDGYAHSEV